MNYLHTNILSLFIASVISSFNHYYISMECQDGSHVTANAAADRHEVFCESMVPVLRRDLKSISEVMQSLHIMYESQPHSRFSQGSISGKIPDSLSR